MQPNEQQSNPETPLTPPVEPTTEVPTPVNDVPPTQPVEAASAPATPTVPPENAPAEPVTQPQAPVPETPQVIPAAAPVETTAPHPLSPNLPQPMSPENTVVMGGAVAPLQPTKSKSNKLKLAALIVGVVLILAAGSAGAYFGVILPNKPENVLKQAVANTLQQKQIDYDGTVDSTNTGKNKDTTNPLANTAVDVAFKGASDSSKNASDTNLTVTVSGIKVQGEVRYVDQNLYFKLGDLSTIKNFAAAYSPEAPQLLGKVENQWIEVDKTLIQQTTGCTLDQGMTFTKDDMTLLSNAYDKTQFAKINSNSSDTVNGKSATKFDLTIDDDKLVDYGKNLDNLSIVKKLKSCSKNSTNKTANSDSAKDHKSTPVTVWVDKGTKRIVKLATKSDSATASVTLSYDPVTIDAPQNAKPFMQVVSEFAPLLNGSGTRGVQGARSTDPLSLLGI